ncbi:MAG: MFS transporter, partial [Anaerovibrio sp.]|nr:MFS transporter [Anaerovibrio sp.]
MNKKLMIIYLGILAAMAPLATDMYLPALPELQADFGSSTSMTQLTLTMTMLGMAVGQIFAGPISDLRGRKLPLLAGMVIFMLSSLCCVFADNIYVFLAARLVQGLAGSCGIVIARAIARDMCQGAELTTFYAVLMMVNGMAPILAPVLGGQILLLSSWHGIFVVLA